VRFDKKIFKLINKFKNPVNWYNLRRLEPISRVFGFDRGTPIDRVYIEHFLNSNKQYIQGVVCEIAENTYSKKYGSNIKAYEILHYTNDNPRATIICVFLLELFGICLGKEFYENKEFY